jgi:hypothetical protein
MTQKNDPKGDPIKWPYTKEMTEELTRKNDPTWKNDRKNDMKTTRKNDPIW